MTAVFWDFHGTLTKPDHIWSESIARALETGGYPLPMEAIRSHITTGFTWHTPADAYEDCTGEQWWGRLYRHFHILYSTRGIPPVEWDNINGHIRSRILDPNTYILYNDAVAALEGCRKAGAVNYLLSNNYPELEQVVGDMGLAPYFGGYIVSACIGFEKPHPRIFEAALELAGHPHTAFMVGDNPDADVAGGRSAGMRTIHAYGAKGYGADYVCQTLAEIPAIVGAAVDEHGPAYTK